MSDLELTPLSDPIRVPVPDGVLVAEDGGDGPPVVCLHAGVADRRSWRPVAAHLSGHRVVAWDRRGFGEATSRAATFDHVADAVAVLDQLEVGPAVLVGNSMGGRVALELALAHPERVTALVLAAPAWTGAPWPDDPPELDELVDALRAADEAGDLDEVNRVEAHVWLDGPLSEEGRVGGELRELFLQMNGRALVIDAQQDGEAVTHEPVWERLGELDVPTAVVVGALDEPAARTLAELAVSRLPNADLHVLDDVAHLPGLEAPAALAEIILEVAAQVG